MISRSETPRAAGAHSHVAGGMAAVLAPLLFMTIEEEGGVGSDQSCWGGGDGCWCIRYYGGAAGEIILVPEAVPEAPVDDEKEGLITEVLDSSPDSVA